MTSKIVVNNIEADAGVSTVFFNSDIGATDGTLNVDGNLTVDGVITYEDVTNVDSIGIVTARSGINATDDITFGTNSKAKLFENGTQSGVQVTNSGSSAHLMTHDGNEDIHVDPSGYIKFEVAGSERVRITSDGNIGIGTDNPTDHLQIHHTNAKGLTFKTTENHYAQITADSNRSSSDNHLLAIEGHWNGTPVAEIAFKTGDDTTNKDNGEIIFRTAPASNLASNERLRITSTGKVGIGSEIPQNKLDVAGDVKILDNSPRLFLYDANADGASNATGGFEVFDKDGNKNVFVGAFAPNANNLIFGVTGSERARITSDGKVGIGTDDPERTLSVAGNNPMIQIEGTGGSGKQWSIISSDNTTGAAAASIGGNFVIYDDTSGGLGDVLTLTGIGGSMGLGFQNPFNRLHVDDNGASITSLGNAILNSTQKGIRLRNANNDDSSLGLWFTTGDSHHAGISGQRNDSANTWGTDLRFYTHEDATNDLTYTRERHRINPHGLLINRKGNNAVNTGGTILGRYKYTQQNQSQNYEHVILGADGRKLQDYLDTNSYCIITVCVTGTGTNNMYCQYYYMANSNPNSSSLTHMYGNSGSSSNRPYMVLVNTHDPAWKMNHNSGYTLDIEVAVYGGNLGYTFTTEYGNFTTNP